MIKCCIFDLDGTLLNTITTITYFVNYVLNKNGITPITEEACKYFVGVGSHKLIERALASRGIEDSETVEKIHDEYKRAYDENPLYLTTVYEGIYEMLSELSERGIKLVVMSNKPDFAAREVVSHFFPNTFATVRGAVDGVPLKPDATAAREILKELSVSEREAAWIGDSEPDMQTGKNLGVSLNIGVLWGFRTKSELENAGADVTVSSAKEITGEVLSVD